MVLRLRGRQDCGAAAHAPPVGAKGAPVTTTTHPLADTGQLSERLEGNLGHLELFNIMGCNAPVFVVGVHAEMLAVGK